MKKYYLGIVLFIVLFTVPFHAKAECSYKDIVRLKKLAGNVSFSYRYIETKNNVNFEVTVSNLTSEIYMIDRSFGKYYYSNNEDFTIKGYFPGKTVRFDFYAKDSTCTDKKLFTNYITFPFYNNYHESYICKDIPEFELCQKWLKHDMTYQEFYDSVTKYLNKTEVVPEKPNQEKEEFDWEKVIQFWADYYLYILLTIIIVGGLILLIYEIHERKSDL